VRPVCARILAVSLLAACSSPQIQPNGAAGGKPMGPAGGNVGGGGGGGGTGAPDFTAAYPDASAGGDAPVTPSGPGAACAGELHEGKLVPVDLLFLLDISGSMEESAGTQSKWVAVRDAVSAFLNDPKSAGLGVGMETFPPPPRTCQTDGDCGGGRGSCEQKGICSEAAQVAITEQACNAATETTCTNAATSPCTKYGTCARSGLRCTDMGQPCPGGVAGDTCTPRPRFCTDDGGASCPAARYEAPIVAIADLPGVRPAVEMALAGIVPQGSTPTTPAVQGALTALRARAMASADRKPVLVLATDGLPTSCLANTVDTAVAQLSGAQMGTPPVSTYVIGVFSPAQLAKSRPALERMATAGGTGAPFVLMTGADLSQRFLDAINQIRGAALGCEFTIPRPTQGTLDFAQVNVRLKDGAATQDLTYVESMDRCDAARGGWYYDVKPTAGTPARVLLCPTTCTQVKMTAGVSIDLRFGCKTIIE
jgi:hypothetical protein